MTTTSKGETFVTFIYSEKLSWLVARYLLESSQLTKGFQVWAYGQSFPSLRAERSDLERLLRRDLPEMTGLVIWEHAMEITSGLQETEVIDRLRLGSSARPPARTTKIVPGLHTTLTVFPCGFGGVAEECGYQFFRHELALDRIRDEEQLREVFWKEINPHLPVPFYDGKEPRPQALTTLRGTVEELRETLEAFRQAISREAIEKHCPQGFQRDFTITAARSKRSRPEISYANAYGFTPPGDVSKALGIISRHYHLIGTTLEAKPSRHGHAGHAFSNFKLEPLRINFSPADDPPARVRMAARGFIRRWAEENAPDAADLFEKLCGEFSPIEAPAPSHPSSTLQPAAVNPR